MRAVISALSLHKPASRRLGAAAVVLLSSAAAHVVVLLVSGGEWAGPVSLRKPITFGLSISMLLWTLGWVIDRLGSRPRLEKGLSRALVISGLLEVGLITVQAWRGVPSHFNYTTVTDLIVFVFMGVTVAVLSVGLLVTTVLAFSRPPTDPTIRLAVRAGMVLVVTGLGIGQWMIELGNDFVEQTDRVPDPVLAGEAGVPTFPHALAFHGIQVFLGAAILAGFAGLAARSAQRVVRLVVAGYSSLMLWAIVQAAVGQAPVDLAGVQTGLAVTGIALLAAAGVQLLVGWRQVRAEKSAGPIDGPVDGPVGYPTGALGPVNGPVRYQTGTLEPARETDTAVPSVL